MLMKPVEAAMRGRGVFLRSVPETVPCHAQVMILTLDKEKGRVSLSTKKLEPTPSDMVRDPNLVFTRADEMAAAFR